MADFLVAADLPPGRVALVCGHSQQMFGGKAGRWMRMTGEGTELDRINTCPVFSEQVCRPPTGSLICRIGFLFSAGLASEEGNQAPE